MADQADQARRRELALVALACAAAAGLALFAASRAWTAEVLARPAPLPPVHRVRSGGSVVPLLPALAVVALAGAGALVATRGWPRRLLGVLLAACGAGIVVTAGYALAAVDAVMVGGPAVALVAGAVLGLVGVVTLRRSGSWPGLGIRYAAPTRVPSTAVAERPAQLWDAINRGEDPTKD
jgi:Tryptophan-associated transmembrane protein (Trp_oprn_chp)